MAPPLSAAEVRAVLLALNGPDKPYLVRNAHPAEKADLVVEWRILHPAAGSGYSTGRWEQGMRT
ncbi:hypothetical protein ACJ6WE_15420 [Streptomyces sp. MMS24-I31]|uniref:hypothetical protein n=1 Tax=Streptomyces sp. MMS24-I31 TaxID=3351563 RepID=UPI003896B58D